MLSSICFMPASLMPQSLPPLHAQHGLVLRRQHGRDVHARRVVPDEERLVGLLRVVAVEEVDDLGRDLLVHGPRPLERQRALVLARLVLLRAVGGLAPDDRARRRQAGRGLRIHGAGDLGEAGDRRVLARRRDALHRRGVVDVGEAHLLHRVQVVEIAPVLLEAVRRRQGRGVVAQVVLAELAGGVAEIEQELGERRGAGPQIGRAAGQLRRDHARAQRIHAGEEGIAPGGAALHGDVVHEDRALVPDAVDVGRFPDHQAAVVDARLHPADVVAHDEQDVGLALGPGSAGHSEHDRQGQRQHSPRQSSLPVSHARALRPRRCGVPDRRRPLGNPDCAPTNVMRPRLSATSNIGQSRRLRALGDTYRSPRMTARTAGTSSWPALCFET